MSREFGQDILNEREALRHLRQCLADHGIVSDLATPAEIERAIGRLAGEAYLDGYADHVSVKWQEDEANGQ